MSIRHKIPLLILTAVLLNILFIGMYYNLSLSKKIAAQQYENQMMLDQETFEMASSMMEDSGQILKTIEAMVEKVSLERGYYVQILSREGDTLVSAGDDSGIYFRLKSKQLLQVQDEIYLLQVTKHIPLSIFSTFDFINDLFVAEFIIIMCVLFSLTVSIYVNMTKPIVALQKDILQYQKGQLPEASNRKDELGALQRDFRQLAQALDEEKVNQSRMIASISHDIKTPLTSVMGYAEQLSKGNLSPERQKNYIETIRNKAGRIKELVDEFDEYISFQTKLVFKRNKVSIDFFLKTMEEEYKEELGELGIALVVSNKVSDGRIRIDVQKMNRVVGNIIGNSTKFIVGASGRIELTAEEVGSSYQFEISDNGSGIGNASYEDVFEPFYTTDESRTVAGLGLSICKSIIEGHEGKIWAAPNDGGGLTIGFTLPKLE